MTEQESNRIWREAHRTRRDAQRVVPDWANDPGDRLGMLYGVALAVGGVVVITGILWLAL